MGCCVSTTVGNSSLVPVDDHLSGQCDVDGPCDDGNGHCDDVHEILEKPKIKVKTYSEEEAYTFGEGAYLVYEPKDMGLMLCVWSKTLVPDSIGYFRPSKTIPEFKYTHNGGRNILKRGANERKLFYQAWAEFCKQGVAIHHSSEIHIFPHVSKTPHQVKIVMHESCTNSLWLIREGQWFDFSAELAQAISIVHPDCEEFSVATHTPLRFLELGRFYGQVFQVDVSVEQVADAKPIALKTSSTFSEIPLACKSLSKDMMQMQPETGAYLVFKQVTKSLYVVWAHEPVQGALAYFKPTKPVPQHNFKKGGERELQRACDDRRVEVRAWAEFLKLGMTQWAADRIYIYETQVLVVFVERSTHTVHRITTTGWMDVDFSKMDQCAVANTDVMAFEVRSMAPTLFKQRGAACGKVFDLRQDKPNFEGSGGTKLSPRRHQEPNLKSLCKHLDIGAETAVEVDNISMNVTDSQASTISENAGRVAKVASLDATAAETTDSTVDMVEQSADGIETEYTKAQEALESRVEADANAEEALDKSTCR